MDELEDKVIDQGGFTNEQAPLPNATPVLVLGIISIVGCIFYAIPGIVCGIIAIVMHKKDKALYLQNPKKYEFSFKNSKAGNVCAIIGLSMSVLYIFILIGMLFFAASMGSAFFNLNK